MGGIISRTNPSHCTPESNIAFEELRREQRLHSLLANLPSARLRRHILCEGKVATCEDIQKRLDESFVKIDIKNPFAKRGLLMPSGVAEVFEDTFRDIFFYEDYNENKCRNGLLLAAAIREDAVKHDIIHSDTRSDETVFIVEKGSVLVSMNKHVIRRLVAPITYLEWLGQGNSTNNHVDRGPSNASLLLHKNDKNPVLRCVSDACTVWGLKRTDFRNTISIVSVCRSIQRCVWLSSCEELAFLGRASIMKIVNNLTEEVFEDGETIFLRNKVGSKLILIESGTAHIKLSQDILEMDISKEETADYLGIVRPEGGSRRAVHDMSGSQLVDFLLFHADRRSNDYLDEAAPVETLPLDPYAIAPPEDILELTAGCLIGSRILRGKGKFGSKHWDWLNAQFVDELWSGDVGLGGKSIPGSKSPLTVKAFGKVRCLSFSVEIFEKLFGETENVLSPFKIFEEDVDVVDVAEEDAQNCTDAIESIHTEGLDEESLERREKEKAVTTSSPRRRRLMSCYTRSVERPSEELIEDLPLLIETDTPVCVIPQKSAGRDSSIDILRDVFTSKFIFKNFVNSIFLKRGSFGQILIAEYVHSISEKQTDDELRDIQNLINAPVNPEGVYILKLSQRSERTVAEALILQELCHPYVMKCFGLIDASPQGDGSKVAMITEVLYSGDLWDVLKSAQMNETFADETNYTPGNGLPLELVKFYSSCVIFALQYMHDKGIAYRNLRPENVLLDSRGQIRLIDFVFAKKIKGYDPAEEHTYEEHCRSTRSFTLCNSPEYVAPEMIYGTGHDHGVDYWAVGIFLYELFTGTTPFLPEARDKSNVCEIFRNIADPRRNIGINSGRFHSSLDGRRLAGVISSILKQYAWQRTGYLYNSIAKILEDRFFEEVELDLVEGAEEVAKYRPPCKLSIYKAYVDHIASNKALVVDDFIQYKMKIPRGSGVDCSCWEDEKEIADV